MMLEQIASPWREKMQEQGFDSLMEVQSMVFPRMAEGTSLMVEAPTGSGKTLAYLLPLLHRLKGDRKIRFLILAPTKELGSQIVREIRKFTDSVLFLPDEVGRERQLERLKKIRPEILVGMAGRFMELIRLGKLKLTDLEYIVLDEGDKVLKGPGKAKVEGILKAAYDTTPLAFFSATYRPEDHELISSYRKDLEFVSAEGPSGIVEHYYLMSDPKRKLENMFKVLRSFNCRKALIFLSRGEGAEGLARRIGPQSREVFVLHTDMDLQKRKSVLEHFRESPLAILLTTDVFSRGLDIPDADGVIHYDLPRTGNIYIHRSGRTGRGFASGTVVTLVSEEEKGQFYEIRRQAKAEIRQIGFRKDGELLVFQEKDKGGIPPAGER